MISGDSPEALALDVRDLRMRYGTRDVLAGVSFTARRGEVVALLGPNGAGKTTTIEILEGFRARIGVTLGSMVRSSAQSGLVFLASMLLVVPSGIFQPITALPVWLQWVGQAFPCYWLGLGARSAMLSGDMVAAEIGGSWRTADMFAVLGVWAVIGMLLAPVFLRRMARRQSGSAVARARESFMSKGY